jgi:YwhD family
VEKKKNNAFTIMKDDSTDGHGGYGVGAISLENMSPVIVDPHEKTAYVDMAAMHARSQVERRVRFQNDKEKVQDGKRYWIVWVTVQNSKDGPYYLGAAASEIIVDRPNRIAYKSMPEHVKHMEQSMKGMYVLEHMDELSKELLLEFFKTYKPEFWERTSKDLENQLQ